MFDADIHKSLYAFGIFLRYYNRPVIIQMRKKFLPLVLGIILCSCEKKPIIDSHNYYQGVGTTERTSVSYNDVVRYLNLDTPYKKITKSDTGQEITIDPIIDIYGDTLFYAVNSYPGWKLISSDTRLPIVLAESPTGIFDITTVDQASATWLETMAEEIRDFKNQRNTTSYMDESPYEASFADIWKTIRQSNNIYSYNIGNDEPLDCGYLPYSSITETETLKEVQHLIQQTWHQHSPYNNYCPLKSGASEMDSNPQRAPAGCVAVAGAQMLDYLHKKIGRPSEAPSQAFISGHVGNYTQLFSGYSSYPLENMNDIYAAMLIGDVGGRLDMNYGDDESYALTEDLIEVFDSYGITCEYGDFNETTVTNHLLDSLPIVVRADGTKKTILGIPTYQNGHSFIIDGYRLTREKTTETYVRAWLTYDADSVEVHTFDFTDTYTSIKYTTPKIEQVKMNWGWVDPSNSYPWYTLLGNWHTNNPTLDFDYRRKMLYNYQPK